MTTETTNNNALIQERIRQLRAKIYSRKNSSEPKTNNEFQVRNYESCTIWVRVR